MRRHRYAKIAEGKFRAVAHETKGTAVIDKSPDGKQVLRFSGFETSNGPDVQVYLVDAADAKNNETATRAGFIRIADLKGSVGDPNYDLPAIVNLNKYRTGSVELIVTEPPVCPAINSMRSSCAKTG